MDLNPALNPRGALNPKVPPNIVSSQGDLGDSVIMTRLSDAIAWCRKWSLFPYPFITACCGMEFMAAAASHYDLDRFGAALPRFSPRQADLMWVVGTVTHKQAPYLRQVYDQMAEPKWVLSFGVCATSGGFYRNYATVQGIDQIVPVDMYIPGCPPRPEMVLDGIMKIMDRIQGHRKTVLAQTLTEAGIQS